MSLRKPSRTSLPPRGIARIAAVVFLFVLLLIVAPANLGIGREYYGWWIESFPGNDILGHFFLMGALSFMVNYALSDRRFQLSGLRLQLGSVGVAVFVAAEEFSQLFMAARTFSLVDLAADMTGIAFFGWLAATVSAREAAQAVENGPD